MEVQEESRSVEKKKAKITPAQQNRNKSEEEVWLACGQHQLERDKELGGLRKYFINRHTWREY